MRHFGYAAAITLMAYGMPALAQECAREVTTIEPGKLRVAAYDYPPFTVVGADGSISGIDPDIIARVAADNCLEVVPLVMDPAATVQAVISGRADAAIGSWNRTADRAEVLGIAAPTYLDPMGIFSKDGIDTIDALVGRNVGTVTGYLWVEDLQALLGDSLKLYPNAVALAQDLETGRIDAAADGYNYGVYSQNELGAYDGITIKLAQPDERVQASVQPAQASVLYTLGNESLGQALDEGIAALHTEGAIRDALVAAGFDAAVADVGEPRLVE